MEGDFIEIVDFEESESDEKDPKEQEDEKKEFHSYFLSFDEFKQCSSASILGYANGFPPTPWLEILSPPPDFS
jgi:hypothetical protein